MQQLPPSQKKKFFYTKYVVFSPYNKYMESARTLQAQRPGSARPGPAI